MGRMFYDLRILNSAEVISVRPDSFVTGYAGQAAQKTHEILLSAVGKTLFIDEAYGCYHLIMHQTSVHSFRVQVYIVSMIASRLQLQLVR